MATQSNQAARGNALQIPHSIHLLPGEKAVMSIRPSRVLLIGRLLLLALLLVLVLVVATYGPISWPIAIGAGVGAGVIVLVLLVWMVSIYIYYRYNICLLTSHRIIQIKRSLLLIREKRIETEYDNIREVRVNFVRLFRIGTVDIEMMRSTSPDIRLIGVDRPLDIQDEIYELRDKFEQEQYGIEQRSVQNLQNLLAAIATDENGPMSDI